MPILLSAASIRFKRPDLTGLDVSDVIENICTILRAKIFEKMVNRSPSGR
jgi:hypothetical protein